MPRLRSPLSIFKELQQNTYFGHIVGPDAFRLKYLIPELISLVGMLAVEPILILLTIYMALVYGVSPKLHRLKICFNFHRFYTYSSKHIQSLFKRGVDGLKDWAHCRSWGSQLGSLLAVAQQRTSQKRDLGGSSWNMGVSYQRNDFRR